MSSGILGSGASTRSCSWHSSQIPLGIGYAMTYPSVQVAALSDVEGDKSGLASGLLFASFQIGGGIVLAAASAVFSAAKFWLGPLFRRWRIRRRTGNLHCARRRRRSAAAAALLGVPGRRGVAKKRDPPCGGFRLPNTPQMCSNSNAVGSRNVSWSNAGSSSLRRNDECGWVRPRTLSDPRHLAEGTAAGGARLMAADAEGIFRRLGITFAVYGSKEATEKIIPFDVIPRIISAMEWRRLSQGHRAAGTGAQRLPP